MADFTRELRCAACGREYLVSGAIRVPGSETEVLAQIRCSCGEWMGAFVPGSADVERLIVTLRGATRLAGDSPFDVPIDGNGRKQPR